MGWADICGGVRRGFQITSRINTTRINPTRIKRWERMLVIGGLIVIAALIAFLVMQRRKESSNRATR